MLDGDRRCPSSLRNEVLYLYQVVSIFVLYILYHLIDHKYLMCFFFILYICMPILQAYLTIALCLSLSHTHTLS